MIANREFEYQPGVCNIDSVGVRFRRRLGFISLAAGILSLVAMYWVGLPVVFRVIVCAGFGYSISLNFMQAKEHFCVANASRGTMEIHLKPRKIANKLYEELDRKKRNAMLVRALFFTLLAASLGLLPLQLLR